MANKRYPNTESSTYMSWQVFFNRYFVAVLIDLTVLNLFDEYWDFVQIDSFTISLLTAVLLQIMLKITIQFEHRIARYFKSKPGLGAKILLWLSSWLLLFGSKLIILEAVNFFFGDRVLFTGPVHGLVSFIVVVLVMLIAELLVLKIFKALGKQED